MDIEIYASAGHAFVCPAHPDQLLKDTYNMLILDFCKATTLVHWTAANGAL